MTIMALYLPAGSGATPFQKHNVDNVKVCILEMTPRFYKRQGHKGNAFICKIINK